jgi:hypothetical protein
VEKYKELYELSKEVLKEELSRFARIDDKAAKYLSVLTLVAGAAAYFGKWVIDNLIPPKTPLEWVLVIVATILCATIFVAWLLVFNALRLHNVTKPPLNDEMVKFFDDNEMIDIYYALTKGNKKALRVNRDTTDRKSKRLYHGYNAIIVSGFVLVMFLSLFVLHSWNNPKNLKQEERSITMTKAKDEKPQGSEKPSSDKPNPNIVPPTYDVVTEGYDPSKVQTKKGGEPAKKK